jgi:hypothetical protein
MLAGAALWCVPLHTGAIPHLKLIVSVLLGYLFSRCVELRCRYFALLTFVENTDVIIFLCPVSCFDERLDEDTRVNRLEDSTLLWRSICSSKLLTRTQLILFLVSLFMTF